MSGLDDELVQRVDQLGRTAWSGETFRYTGAKRDPLSGAGARLFGGRWNPKDIFATIYLATPIEACLGEVKRTADSQETTPETMLRADYVLHKIEVAGITVLDLRDNAALEHVGLTTADIEDPDWTACQSVGNAAWFLGHAGILAPSATGDGHVLAAFETRATPYLHVVTSTPLTPATYLELQGK